MNKLELFEEKDFNGTSTCLTDNNSDLSACGFHNKASSLCITGDPWVVYTDKDYGGDFEVYKEGKYSSIPGIANKISSAKVVKGGLYDPKIIVYEHIDYNGKAVTITEETRSLKNYDLDNTISSHKVLSGCWILYDQENYQGYRFITVAGENFPNYVPLGWNDVVSSLKPAVPYTTRA